MVNNKLIIIGKSVGLCLSLILFFSSKNSLTTQQATMKHFDKVVVSPYIEVIFKQGSEESFVMQGVKGDKDKLNIKVKNGVLFIYMQDAEAKVGFDKEKSIKFEDSDLYGETMARVIITYKSLKKVALAGKETYTFQGETEVQDLFLKLIGETKVYIDDANIENFDITLLGKNYLKVKSGNIVDQDIISTGMDQIDMLDASNNKTQIKVLGNGEFKFNVSKKINVNCVGEAKIFYKGMAKLSEGLMMGGAYVEKI